VQEELGAPSRMASEAATVLLALIGICIIVIGVMILMQRPLPEKEVAIRPTDYQWRGHYYSHLPVRPILAG